MRSPTARNALKNNCEIVVDIPPVSAALDHTRAAHLGTKVNILINDPHVYTASEAENQFWQHQEWREGLKQVNSWLYFNYRLRAISINICFKTRRTKTAATFFNYRNAHRL